jgi:thioredoxin:protein disulfide reductase
VARSALVAALTIITVVVGALAADIPADVVRGRLSVRAGEAVVEVTIAPGWHVNASAPRDAFMIPTTLTVAPPPGVTAGAVVYPDAVERRLAVAGDKPVLLYEGTVRMTAALSGTPTPGAPPLRAVVRYQACDDGRCLPPRSLELVAATEPAASTGPGGGAENQVARWIERFGWGTTFLLVFALGMALNLTPCVYPLISVTIAFFGGRAGGASHRPIARALLYVLGICLTFSVLGVTAALTGSLFGAALQKPPVLAGLALVLVGLALSNFGLYTLRFPTPFVQRVGRVGEGGLGAFFMGLTMGVVAAPCIGPLVAALLLFVGARQAPALGFALFFTLGLGIGAPYVGLAALAGRLRRLPRAGAWLAWVERLFGFVLLGMALYFASPLLPAAWSRIIGALLIAGAGVVLGFVGAREMPRLALVRRAAGVLLVAFALSGLLGAEARGGVAWTAFSDEALAAALAGGRPVLIDFEAEWCLPCREMERTTFRDAEVVRATTGLVPLKVDVTNGDDRASLLMDRYHVVGVPTYVLLGADGVERRRFVGFVSAAEMRAALSELGRARGGLELSRG